MEHRVEVMPEDWQRMLAIVAHPDDLEYGAASAIARWTRAGKWVGYVIVTDGEAGIDGLPPGEAGPIRVAEQEHSARLVGVDDVTFLGYPDGVVEPTPALRRDLAREIRRARPDVLLIATYDLTYGLGAGQRIVNQADHRAVGVATFDAARDAGNRWIFPELARRGRRALAGSPPRVRDGLQRADPRGRRHRHPRGRCRVTPGPPDLPRRAGPRLRPGRVPARP